MEDKALSLDDKLDLKRKNRTEKGKISSDSRKPDESNGHDEEEANKRQKRMSFKERRASRGSLTDVSGRKASFTDAPKLLRVSFSKPSPDAGATADEQSMFVHTVSVQPDSLLHVEVENINEKDRKVNIRGSTEVLPSADVVASPNPAEVTGNYFVLNDGFTVGKNVQPTKEIGVALSAVADVDVVISSGQKATDQKKKEEIVQVLRSKGHDITFVQSGIKIEELLEQHVAKGAQTAFYLCDITTVLKKFVQWKELLPRVEPFYAMKCCPDPVLLIMLRHLGAGFDVASMGEIGLALDLNTPKNEIIYANPIKMTTHIEYAKANQVTLMTFDSVAELHKVKQHFPIAELVVRVLPPESKLIANTSFGSKFGATWDDCSNLFKVGKELGLNIRGVSYHVGSGCYDLDAFEEAVKYARKVFDLAATFGYDMDFLDIGGGFPGSDDGPISFPAIANRVRPAIDALFPKKVRVIAEPGRYFANAAMTLAANIITCREKKVPDANSPTGDRVQRLYYLSDGVYGSFNCIFFDHNEPTPHVLSESKSKTTSTRNSTLFGPTCDSIDVICKDVSLPELEIGDWLYFPNMGAYTRAAGSNFNGFPIPKVIYICS